MLYYTNVLNCSKPRRVRALGLMGGSSGCGSFRSWYDERYECDGKNDFRSGAKTAPGANVAVLTTWLERAATAASEAEVFVGANGV
jgi:hypothetical protein